MQRFILTGAPGAGKTTLIRELGGMGFGTVAEAATDLIADRQALGVAEPWLAPDFIDAVTALQRRRQIAAQPFCGQPQFHDRSVICTYALAQFLGQPVSLLLAAELRRIEAEHVFARRVFLIQNLGFVTPTPARRITFEASLAFERLHEEAYRACGYEIVPIPPGSVAGRIEAILSAVASRSF